MSTHRSFYEPQDVLIDLGGWQIELQQGRVIVEYERTDGVGAQLDSYGIPIIPAEPDHYELIGVRVMDSRRKMHNADWILDYLTDDDKEQMIEEIEESLK